ncbi:hypothetical protein ABPG72_019173 [Tetrahymena utriculariae]
MFAFRKLVQQQQRQSFNYLLNAYFGTIKPFKLPDLGEKIKEATVKKLYVKEGDIVEEFQTIADVATDKLFTQIPSSYSGKIHKVFHKEEDTCLVGDVFVEIEVDDSHSGDAPTTAHTHEAKQKKKENATTSSSATTSTETKKSQAVIDNTYENDYVLSTPAVRSLARQHNINLKNVRGSGKDGRVMKNDILDIISGKTKPVSSTTEAAKPKAASTAQSGVLKETVKTTVKMSDFQKGMQKSMTEANTIPHLYLKDEYDLTNLTLLREQIKKSQNQSITFMTFFIKAFSLALKEYPILNSLYDVNKPFEYTLVENHNISLAVDSPKGLVVPNIKNVQNLSILDIQKEIKRLVKEGEAGTLGPKDLFDGSICISNIGTIGGTYTGPLIFAPQTTIVGLGRVMNLPRYINKSLDPKVEDLELAPRKIMNVSFGCDHRVVDGATVTKFSNKWKSYLEDPSTMLLHLK